MTARAKAIEVMGQLGKLGDETFPARILESWACAQERKAASFAQLRSRVEKKSLSPFNNKVYGLDATTCGRWHPSTL